MSSHRGRNETVRHLFLYLWSAPCQDSPPSSSILPICRVMEEQDTPSGRCKFNTFYLFFFLTGIKFKPVKKSQKQMQMRRINISTSSNQISVNNWFVWLITFPTKHLIFLQCPFQFLFLLSKSNYNHMDLQLVGGIVRMRACVNNPSLSPLPFFVLFSFYDQARLSLYLEFFFFFLSHHHFEKKSPGGVEGGKKCLFYLLLDRSRVKRKSPERGNKKGREIITIKRNYWAYFKSVIRWKNIPPFPPYGI